MSELKDQLFLANPFSLKQKKEKNSKRMEVAEWTSLRLKGVGFINYK
jgi:hypothetical protein